MKTILAIIASVFFTLMLSQQSFKKHYNEQITNRVYEMWGEGDMGESVNHYLLTGDKSDDFFGMDTVINHEYLDI